MGQATSVDDQAGRRLLQEGARSYFKAANALIAFQREVQKKCRRVMATHMGHYGAALKIKLDSSEIEDIAWPKVDEWEGDWASVGVRLVRRNVIVGVRWWEAYCCLEWESSDPDCYCYVGEWFPTKLATELGQRFKPLNPDVEV